MEGSGASAGTADVHDAGNASEDCVGEADRRLVERSFEQITDRHSGAELTSRFYERLFSRHPEVVELFGRHSMAAQQQMLLETLTGVLEHLSDVSWLKANMEALGVKHHGYDVSFEMYDWWRVVMLDTLAQLSDNGWSDELGGAWDRQLRAICALVRDAGPGAPGTD